MKNESIYDISVTTIEGFSRPMSEYKGKVLLIVNTASKCGFTPQYDGLEKLYKDHKDKGFAVLGFPSNQFMKQELGSDGEIKSFCTLNFNITFPMFSKIDVNGPDTHPLYEFLKREAPGIFGRKIKWNFTKFLVDSDGRVVKRYAPATVPEKIEKDILKVLG